VTERYAANFGSYNKTYGSLGAVVGFMTWIWQAIKWPVLFVVAGLALAVLYRYAPSRREAKWRWITWGSAVATVGWIVISILFSRPSRAFGAGEGNPAVRA
jgi:uncharacterized BrkB/YihY/UPF0761 family membrane protein